MLELLTGLLVTVAAVALVIEPLVSSRVILRPGPESEFDPVDLTESESPKIKALLALKEIEFDQATGKLSDTDYAMLREQYTREAVEALHREDAVASEGPPGADAAERAVQAARTQRRTCPDCGVRPEPGAVYCSTCGRSLVREGARPRCWICGADLRHEARFCAECGVALGTPET